MVKRRKRFNQTQESVQWEILLVINGNKTYLVKIGKGQSTNLYPKICLKLFNKPKLNPFLSTRPFSNMGALNASVRSIHLYINHFTIDIKNKIILNHK